MENIGEKLLQNRPPAMLTAFHHYPCRALSRSGRVLRSLCAIVAVSMVMLGAKSLQAFDTVILDAGHGGHDRGASIGYVFEKHLALDTTRRVQQHLRAKGIRVIMTRSSDVFIPLQGRSAIGNNYPNSIFVSIHYNYSRGGSGNGLETFYHHDQSYRLGGYIQAYIVQESRLANRGLKKASFHVIRETRRNPAVLVECGFVSNSGERAAMMAGNYRERLAAGIAKGILAYRADRR